AGNKANFGYTMKYNKNGTNAQGSLLVICHMPDGTTYRIKSNALGGLSLGDNRSVPMGWASFTGKATYVQPGWSDPAGNYTFIVQYKNSSDAGHTGLTAQECERLAGHCSLGTASSDDGHVGTGRELDRWSKI